MSIHNLKPKIEAFILVLRLVLIRGDKLLVKEEYFTIEPSVEHDLRRCKSRWLENHEVGREERVRALGSMLHGILVEGDQSKFLGVASLARFHFNQLTVMVLRQSIRIIHALFLWNDCGFLLFDNIELANCSIAILFAIDFVLRLHNLHRDKPFVIIWVGNALYEAIFNVFKRHTLIAVFILIFKETLDELFAVHVCCLFG